jgi:hypothetical protein
MTNDNTTAQTQSSTPAPTLKRDESAVGGYYHGPSNQAGLTNREYWEMMDLWEDEKYDRKYNW